MSSQNYFADNPNDYRGNMMRAARKQGQQIGQLSQLSSETPPLPDHSKRWFDTNTLNTVADDAGTAGTLYGGGVGALLGGAIGLVGGPVGAAGGAATGFGIGSAIGGAAGALLGNTARQAADQQTQEDQTPAINRAARLQAIQQLLGPYM